MEFPSGDHRFDIGGGVQVWVRIALVGGIVDVTSLTVTGTSVTSDVLRSVRVGEIRKIIRDDLRSTSGALLDLRALLAQNLRATGREVPEHLVLVEKHARAAVESLRSRSPQGSRPTPDDDHRNTALAYIAAYHLDPRRPVLVLAEQIDIPRSTVADRVRRARAAGWLAETRPGVVGAEAGLKLIEWLEKEAEL